MVQMEIFSQGLKSLPHMDETKKKNLIHILSHHTFTQEFHCYYYMLGFYL